MVLANCRDRFQKNLAGSDFRAIRQFVPNTNGGIAQLGSSSDGAIMHLENVEQPTHLPAAQLS